MHWTVFRRAHITPDTGPIPRGSGSLDDASTRCLSCHDGVSAREAHFGNSSSGGGADYSDKRRNHPVGIPFRSDRPATGTKLRPVSILPAVIRLPEGQVSCVSCHNLYSTDRSRLSVPIDGSALCFGCHDMD